MSDQKLQDLKNHGRIDPLYHLLSLAILALKIRYDRRRRSAPLLRK